jgi:hypothetical protein
MRLSVDWASSFPEIIIKSVRTVLANFMARGLKVIYKCKKNIYFSKAKKTAAIFELQPVVPDVIVNQATSQM